MIKLAIDVHGTVSVVARQLDNATPQPPQKFKQSELLAFIAKQVTQSQRVVCCYEAGCFGFVLARQIQALGAECLVIAPQNWDERNKKMRTDKTDALGMLLHLDRYLAGNAKALAVVWIPPEAHEVARCRVRQREQFMADRSRSANRGKSVLLEFGMQVSWSWWKADRWTGIQEQVREQMPLHAPALLKILQMHQEAAMQASERMEELTREQQARQKQRREQHKELVRLRGIGDLSMSRLDAEIGDWNRFKSRRQVGSYTGLCSGACGTCGVFSNLPVNKAGNRRLRSILVELAWLLPRYQPDYRPLARWKKVLEGTNRSAKKKAIVSLARRLAVDLWRIQTHQCTPEKLGLKRAA